MKLHVIRKVTEMGMLCLCLSVTSLTAGCKREAVREFSAMQEKPEELRKQDTEIQGDNSDIEGAEEKDAAVHKHEMEEADNLKAKTVGEAEASLQEAGKGASKQTEKICFVYVCGAVNKPGVYQLEAGSRIYEAVEAAEGLAEGAVPSYLNLADEILDGMKVVIPFEEDLTEEERYGSQTPAAEMQAMKQEAAVAAAVLSGKINLNTASKKELMTLSGIGEVKAEQIIEYRETKGAFRTIEDVMKVDGIKESAFEKIKDKITV